MVSSRCSGGYKSIDGAIGHASRAAILKGLTPERHCSDVFIACCGGHRPIPLKFAQPLKALLAFESVTDAALIHTVDQIISDVRASGSAHVPKLTQQFDQQA